MTGADTLPLRPERPIASGKDANLIVEQALARDGSTVLLMESDFDPAFFDLRSGLAGEVLQKMVNFRLPTAVVVSDPARHGERFRELAWEHGAHPLVRFFTTEDDARQWLAARAAAAT